MTITIKQADLTGENIEVKKSVSKGQKLKAHLEYKATGYIWKLTKDDPKNLKAEGEPKVERTKNEPGASEYKVYRFGVLESGELQFQLARPFGKSDPKMLTIKIYIRD